MMRALRVGRSRCEHVETCAHGRHAQKLAVQLAASGELRLEFIRMEESGFCLSQKSSPDEPRRASRAHATQLHNSSNSVSSPWSLVAITCTALLPGY
jgi:hypothetical protein